MTTPMQTTEPTTRPNRRARTALSLGAIALVAAACNINVDFEEGVVQEFETAEFSSIRIDAPFDVTVRQGDTQSVTVEVGESSLDDLAVDVDGGELRIDLDGRWFNHNSDLVATITVTDLDAVHASSASSVVIVGVDLDELSLTTDGASSVRMSGDVDELDLSMSQASSAELIGTSIETVTVELSGASSAELPSTVGEVGGSLSGASSLEVAETTTVRVETSGASSIDRN